MKAHWANVRHVQTSATIILQAGSGLPPHTLETFELLMGRTREYVEGVARRKSAVGAPVSDAASLAMGRF